MQCNKVQSITGFIAVHTSGILSANFNTPPLNYHCYPCRSISIPLFSYNNMISVALRVYLLGIQVLNPKGITSYVLN